MCAIIAQFIRDLLDCLIRAAISLAVTSKPIGYIGTDSIGSLYQTLRC